MKIKVNNVEETIELGKNLGELLQPNTVITLKGQLGAGKTTFTKGIAAGMGIKRIVKSPTFTIVREYNGPINLYHLDAYRLEGISEDIGFDEYFYSGSVAVVEWSEFIKEFLPNDLIEIEIIYVSEEEREFVFTTTSDKFEGILEEIRC